MKATGGMEEAGPEGSWALSGGVLQVGGLRAPAVTVIDTQVVLHPSLGPQATVMPRPEDELRAAVAVALGWVALQLLWAALDLFGPELPWTRLQHEAVGFVGLVVTGLIARPAVLRAWNRGVASSQEKYRAAVAGGAEVRLSLYSPHGLVVDPRTAPDIAAQISRGSVRLRSGEVLAVNSLPGARRDGLGGGVFREYLGEHAQRASRGWAGPKSWRLEAQTPLHSVMEVTVAVPGVDAWWLQRAVQKVQARQDFRPNKRRVPADHAHPQIHPWLHLDLNYHVRAWTEEDAPV